MAKWNFAAFRKSTAEAAPHTEPGSAVSAKRTDISKGYRVRPRYRSGAKIELPQGWRATFMNY